MVDGNFAIVLVAEHGFEARDASAVPRFAHRPHDPLRFFLGRIDAGDGLANDLGGAEAQVSSRPVVVINNGAFAIDCDYDVWRAFNQALEIVLIER